MKRYKIRPGSIVWHVQHIAGILAAIAIFYIMLCLGFAL